MDTVQDKTYEAIYYSLWEAARRYSGFTQFRVIGKSHDDRMIPMLEIGHGDACIFCVAGFSGTDGRTGLPGWHWSFAEYMNATGPWTSFMR